MQIKIIPAVTTLIEAIMTSPRPGSTLDPVSSKISIIYVINGPNPNTSFSASTIPMHENGLKKAEENIFLKVNFHQFFEC